MTLSESKTQTIHRPHTAVVIALCFLCAAVALPGAQHATGEPDFVVTILHTNDLHSHDDPFLEGGNAIGGMAQIGHLIRSIRENTPNVITVDAGDIFEGTPYFNFYHGEVEVALLNMIGYDLYTLGNHDFANRPENLASQLAKARFDIISSNMDATRVPALDHLIKRSIVKTFNGKKIAFVGATTRHLSELSLSAGEVQVMENGDDWIAPIRTEVERLQAEGINKIVLLTHVGVEDDRKLAAALPEVDAIIGGHSHTRLNEPIVVRHKGGASTLVVQTGSNGRALGRTRLAFDVRGNLMLNKTDYRLINITDRIAGDPDIQAYLSEKSGPIEALRKEMDGFAAAEFDSQFAAHPWDSPIGDLVCDALAERAAEYGATIAFQNRGGIRSGLQKGRISEENVEEILPFNDLLTFATVSGKLLLKALQNSLSENLRGRFLDVHGLKLAYDPSAPADSRLVFALAESEAGLWTEIKPEGKYRIAINDYSFKGAEGYDFSGATDIEHTRERLTVMLSDYLRRHKEVKPQPPTRIVPVRRDMLAIVKRGGQKQLFLKCGVPRARLTLVAGSAPGIEPVADGIPVPLSNPRVIGTGIRANRFGEYYWALPLEPANGTAWVAVIAHPEVKGDRLKTLISCPIHLTRP